MYKFIYKATMATMTARNAALHEPDLVAPAMLVCEGVGFPVGTVLLLPDPEPEPEPEPDPDPDPCVGLVAPPVPVRVSIDS